MSERAPQVLGSSVFALQEGNTEETWGTLIARDECTPFSRRIQMEISENTDVFLQRVRERRVKDGEQFFGEGL